MALPEPKLTGVVGRQPADNMAYDVSVIQGLLAVYFTRRASANPPGTEDMVSLLGWTPGQFTPAFGDAIHRFQTVEKLGVADGRINPGKGTWQRLWQKASSLPGLVLPAPPAPASRFVRHTERPAAFGPRQNLPQLAAPKQLTTIWDIGFAGEGERPIDFFYYETPKGTKVKYVGVCVPQGVRDPKAYLIYFHHPIHQEPGRYNNDADFLNFGIGDYMVGRMQVMRQLSLSGQDVAIVIPAPVLGGRGEFLTDQDFVRDVLKMIDTDILGVEMSTGEPPLILAGYSGGLQDIDLFAKGCPSLAKNTRAVFDFDGLWAGNLRHIGLGNFAKAGARVLRYSGGASPPPRAKEDKTAFLKRHEAGSPSLIALPIERWTAHSEFHQTKTMAAGWWLHHYIPTCMLQHGLTSIGL
jgi:hypothetical protein